MAVRLRPRFWINQPVGPAPINWGHTRAEGLVFFAPLNAAHGTLDLVGTQIGTRTGLEALASTEGADYLHFGTSNYADYPTVPPQIGATTPFTIAWTQDARATAGASTILQINFGTAGTHKRFLIYQSASDANYYFSAGPQTGAASANLWNSIGAVANDRRDRFCLTVNSGSQSASMVLYRNGAAVSISGATTFANDTAAGFRVGALSTAADPWEGAIGDLRMWSRVLSDTEQERESTQLGAMELYAPRRIWVPVSVAGTFKAAWVRRNTVLGTGARS